MFNQPKCIGGLALAAFTLCGCSDSKIAISDGSLNHRYDLRAVVDDSELRHAQLYVMASEFAVQESKIAPHNYTDQYNGCISIRASIDGEEAILFSFINWSQDEGRLSVKLNWSEEDDASLVLSNDDGGELEAILSTHTDKGMPRRFLMRGRSPSADSGEYCVKQATAG